MYLTLPSDRLGEVDVRGKYGSARQSLLRIFAQPFSDSPVITRPLRLVCIPAGQSAELVLAKTRPASSNISPRHTQKSQSLQN